MHQQFSRRARARTGLKLIYALMLCALAVSAASAQTQAPAAVPTATPAAGSPSRVVLDFYQALRERKFREAFAMSIYKPAVDSLSPQQFDELRPEFEKMAAAVPDRIELNGEQISGEEATVFARAGDDPATPLDSIPLIRVRGQWLFGDMQNYQIVQTKGAAFFPEARIDAHQREVEAVLLLVAQSEATYAALHGGTYTDVDALVASKPSLKDDLQSDTLGYTFHILLSRDAHAYAVSVEPTRYGHTGRLSYYMDATGYKSKDTGGKPFTPPGVKRP
jgi:hypothetical protein